MIDVKKLLISMAAFLVLPVAVYAQGFSSGSTGADGALDLSTMNCPGSVCIVQLPPSGVLNYTTVNITGGLNLRFKRNSHNTPVIMLAQGDVIIAGIIDVSANSDPDQPASSRTPGPGGFYGGQYGSNGFGSGGGIAPCDFLTCAGRWMGSLSLVPIVGGSGGASNGPNGCDGGGGGGAILIASSTTIMIPSGGIRTNGGGTQCGCCNIGNFGSGGAIRLVTNSIGGSGFLQASATNVGVIRLESPTGTNTYTGFASPAAVISSINPAIVSNAPPSLAIVSVGGFAVPSYAGTRFDSIDLLLPSQLSDPIAVQVAAQNIPVGTQVTLGFFGSSTGSSTPGTLSGTLQDSTATATISGLNRSAVTYLFATATFAPPGSAQNFNPKGKDHVVKMRIESGIDGKTKFIFLRSKGTIIDQVKLPKKFLEQLGL
jgi:hypothetical protein